MQLMTTIYTTKILLKKSIKYFSDFAIFGATFPVLFPYKPHSEYYKHLRNKMNEMVKPFSIDMIISTCHFYYT